MKKLKHVEMFLCVSVISLTLVGTAIGASSVTPVTTPTAAAASTASVFAAASLFQDHMVLQRDKPVAVWGTAQPCGTVCVRFAGQTRKTRADKHGVWRLTLAKLSASSEGRPLTIECGGEMIVIHDVLVGEVWLASGQSNMGLSLMSCLNSKEEIAAANFPNLRFFLVPKRGALEPQTSTPGNWVMTSPATAGSFSGVAYFFARELHRQLGVPVGVILSAVGATAAEQWTPAEVLRADPEWNKLMTEQVAEARRNAETARTFIPTLKAWRAANHCEDPEKPRTEWAAPDLDTTGWVKASKGFALGKTLGLKGGGVIWLRKEFDAPPERAGNDTGLWVDRLDRQIMTYYLNGKEIGTIGIEAPKFYQTGMFFFYVPKGLLKAGRNVLAIRCTTFTADTVMGVAGLPIGVAKDADDHWLLKAEVAFPAPSPEALAALPQISQVSETEVASGLYNAMIHPLMPYTIRGAIWYQGESNVWRANRYKELLSALIGTWREHWGQGNFPFYIVQLANYFGATPKPAVADKPNADDMLGRLREAQLQVAQSVKESGLAVAIDLGETDIHPRNKQDVGDRLARLALARTYGMKDIAYLGPRYDSMVKEGSAIRVRFQDCADGLMVAAKQGHEPTKEMPGAKLQQFAIAGADYRFVWAEARIEGDTVVVSSPAVPAPVAVRYAWGQNPEGRNLYGKNGLPAVPFRTDTLPWPEK